MSRKKNNKPERKVLPFARVIHGLDFKTGLPVDELPVDTSVEDEQKSSIICLIGSTKFKKEFEHAIREETLNGNIVLSVAQFSHADNLSISESEKTIFDKVHLKKIEISNTVLVINAGGYIGESTKRELQYAKNLNKSIEFFREKYNQFEPVDEKPKSKAKQLQEVYDKYESLFSERPDALDMQREIVSIFTDEEPKDTCKWEKYHIDMLTAEIVFIDGSVISKPITNCPYCGKAIEGE